MESLNTKLSFFQVFINVLNSEKCVEICACCHPVGQMDTSALKDVYIEASDDKQII